MLPRLVQRFHTATAVQRQTRRPQWVLTALGASVVGGAWFATACWWQPDSRDEKVAIGVLSQLQQQLASLWKPAIPASPSQQSAQQPSWAASAFASMKGTAARWLAQRAEDPESREALLAFGSSRLLDFLITTAVEEPSSEQLHAEQAVANFLGGYHTASRLLARPGALPLLLQHIADGRASPQLTSALQAVIRDRRADFSKGLSLDDARQTIQMLQAALAQGEPGLETHRLLLQLLTAWAEADDKQKVKLCSLGVAPALGQLGMQAVALGEAGRQLQAGVCRLQQLLLLQPSTVTDADLAQWMQPLMYLAADAAAAAAAAAAADDKGIDSSSEADAAARGVLGSGAGVEELALADLAMTTLGAAVAAGGPLVKEVLSGLHWLPTLDCLALSPDPAIKARAAAALATLVTAGQLESQEAQLRWRDMLLGWLSVSASNLLAASYSSSGGGSSSPGDKLAWLWSWFTGKDAAGGFQDCRQRQSAAADEALTRSCVAALTALAQQDGPLGLAVAQLWLSQLLEQLSSKVAAYTTITQLAQVPPQAASAHLTPHAATAAKPQAATAMAAAVVDGQSTNSSRAADTWLNNSIKSSTGSWWKSTDSSSIRVNSIPEHGTLGSAPLLAEAALLPSSAGNSSSNRSSWYWPLSTSTSTPEAEQQGLDPVPAAGSTQTTPEPNMQDTQHRRSNGTDVEGASATALEAETLAESARAAVWRDAAPVTAASAKSAADELKAAANAMLTAWLGTAGSLNLPSDLVPGMFSPAVLEAYPAAAHVVDFSVAQQRTCQVLEVVASVVAEDPCKQAWLLSAGILPVMQRLALHADAQLEPEAFVTRYSSSSSGANSMDRSRDQDTGSTTGGAGQQAPKGGNVSLSTRIGRTFWAWKGNSSGSSSGSSDVEAASGGHHAADLHAAALTGHIDTTDQGAEHVTTSSSTHVMQQDVEHVMTVKQQDEVFFTAGTDAANDHSQDVYPSQACHVTGSDSHKLLAKAPSSLLLLGLQQEFDFSTDGSLTASTPGSMAANAAVLSAGACIAEVVHSRFTAAALTSPERAEPNAAASQAASGPHVHQQSPAPASFKEAAHDLRPQQPHANTAALLMEFAQGAAGWSEVGGCASGPGRGNLGVSAALAAADATAITAAAEEGSSWGDGDGLIQLRMHRQIARILSMLALQPAAAQQLTQAAQKLPGGAAEMLRGLQQLAVVSQHLHRSAFDATAVVNRSSSRGQRHKQAVAAATAAKSAPPVTCTTAAWLTWLLEAAASDDCLLSSYAVKALLHLETLTAYSGDSKRKHQRSLQQQHQAADGATADNAYRAWAQQQGIELKPTEELVQFMDGLWPFSSKSSSSSLTCCPLVCYPDGIHLMHPCDGHNWGMLQPPPVTIIDSLSAAAASAASVAAAAVASDLSQSEIDPTVASVTEAPTSAIIAAASAIASAAAAAAATAAASVLGVTSSEVSSAGSADSAVADEDIDAGDVTLDDSGSENSTRPTADVGFLQPAVSWLAHKLVRFAEIKEEEVQQALQEATSASGTADAAMPLSTFWAVLALMNRDSNAAAGVARPAGCAQDTAAANTASSSLDDERGQHKPCLDAGAAQTAAGQPTPPDLDIVFVHGIRGGPFVSWRKGRQALAPSAAAAASPSGGAAALKEGTCRGVMQRGVALKPSKAAAVHKRHMTQEECWPAAWLAADIPTARLLTVEYQAPVTGWEGESLSLPDCGRLLLDKLVAAGVGQRPVVFVCHSMGGLVVKELLSQAKAASPDSSRGRLADATCGVAFYATPHFGSGMAALGWKLRHLPGASPAPSIHHLSPGPHLAALNARLAELHQSGQVAVLNICEGQATNLAGLDFMPRILIVPFESAYPGFGEIHVLHDQDHISVCKPVSREAPGYQLLMQFVRASVDKAAAAQVQAAAHVAQVSAAQDRAAAAAAAAAASS